MPFQKRKKRTFRLSRSRQIDPLLSLFASLFFFLYLSFCLKTAESNLPFRDHRIASVSPLRNDVRLCSSFQVLNPLNPFSLSTLSLFIVPYPQPCFHLLKRALFFFFSLPVFPLLFLFLLAKRSRTLCQQPVSSDITILIRFPVRNISYSPFFPSLLHLTIIPLPLPPFPQLRTILYNFSP